MLSEHHGNVVYHGVELLLLVSMLLLLTIPKSLLILKEFLGRRRRPYIVFRFRSSYGFMFVYIYIQCKLQYTPLI